jgi:SPP1 gp7 family putative phage head morphogenesis protein
MNSAGISKQIKGFSRTAVKAVEDEVVSGMMAGSSIEDIARRIRKNSEVDSMVRARRIARTMSTDCAAEAKLREYKEIGVEEYRILCTLDERTCATCGALDGKTFPVAGAHPRPSFHPNCRCIVEEVLPPELVQDLTRSARDEDGKTIQVPQSMTYDEWRKRFMKPAKPTARRSAGSAPRARASPRYFEEPDRRKVAVGRPNIPRVEPFAPSMPTPPSQVTAPATSPEEVKPLEERMRPARVAGAERGEPMGFDKADRGEANPHEGERMNCQSCVVANEMRRRGYDVQARAFDPSSPSQAMLSRIPQAAWKDPSTGRVPTPERYPGRTRDSFEQWLDEMIGEGQRYTFFVTWTTSGTGHVVCADRGPRGVRVLDPQTGKVYEGAALTAKYTDRIFMDGTFAPRLLRVDNKVPNLEIVDYALEKKEARDGS